MSRKFELTGSYVWWVLGLICLPLGRWFAIPEITLAQAYAPFVLSLLVFGWFAGAYITITKFDRPAIGWSLVVIGICVLVFLPRWAMQ